MSDHASHSHFASLSAIAIVVANPASRCFSQKCVQMLRSQVSHRKWSPKESKEFFQRVLLQIQSHPAKCKEANKTQSEPQSNVPNDWGITFS
jgi:hypothetical protein